MAGLPALERTQKLPSGGVEEATSVSKARNEDTFFWLLYSVFIQVVERAVIEKRNSSIMASYVEVPLQLAAICTFPLFDGSSLSGASVSLLSPSTKIPGTGL